MEPEPRKKTPEQNSQNKHEPAPTAGRILVLRGCVPFRRGATGPSPGGLWLLPGDLSPALPPYPRPGFTDLGFFLGARLS